MAKKKELEIVKHLTMSQLEVFVVELTARNPHGHDDLEIGLVLEGSLFLYIDQERYRLSRGDIYIINRHQIHSFAKNSPQTVFLHFRSIQNFIEPSITLTVRFSFKIMLSTTVLFTASFTKKCCPVQNTIFPDRIFQSLCVPHPY